LEAVYDGVGAMLDGGSNEDEENGEDT